MGILTAVLAVILILAIFYAITIVRKDYKELSIIRSRLKYIKSLGLFAMVAGFLGQMIGLFSAFTAIQQAQDISPAIMVGGLKVSMIAPMYGILIFLLSYLVWIAVDYLASRQD